MFIVTLFHLIWLYRLCLHLIYQCIEWASIADRTEMHCNCIIQSWYEQEICMYVSDYVSRLTWSGVTCINTVPYDMNIIPHVLLPICCNSSTLPNHSLDIQVVLYNTPSTSFYKFFYPDTSSQKVKTCDYIFMNIF